MIRELQALLHGIDVSPARQRTLRYRLEHYLRIAGPDPDVRRYRNLARDAGYSPATIEATVDLVRRLRPGIPAGDRLKRPSPDPCPPSIESIDRAYRSAIVAVWPRWIDPAVWWRAFFAVACWTGFRLSDLFTLEPGHFGDEWITLRAGKTSKLHRIPTSAFMRRHIAPLCETGVPLFRPAGSRKQFRRELRRIQRDARVEKFTPQNLRQFAITAWSIADAEAGRIIHGCGLSGRDVMLHYVRRPTILLSAAPRVRMPDAFLSDAERASRQDDEARVVSGFREATPSDREIILSLVTRLA